MLSVNDIEKLVSSLPPAQLSEFRAWFAEFDADHWDSQLEADAQSGKLDQMATEALEDMKSGRCTEL